MSRRSLATQLAVRRDITRVVTTDAIRDVLRTVVPVDVLPELHQSTFEVVAPDTVETFAGFLRQCTAVGAAAVAVADRLADEHRSVIVEGVHALPGAVTNAFAEHPAKPVVIERLIIQTGVDEHAELLRRRESSEPHRQGQRHLARLDHIRLIQDHLVQQAERAGITAMDGGEASDLTQDIVDEIVQRLDEPAGSA